MSKQKSKRAARKGQTKTFGDVTINDFANSTAIKHRPKKSSTSLTNIIQLENDQHLKSWDDQDLDDYDYIREENEDGQVIYVLKKLTNTNLTPSTLNNSSNLTNEEQGKDYPVDIWFLIADYIRPEDVGTFARICQTSNSVVNTAKFWYTLYRRYYRNLPELPKRLQPACMFRLYGIRTLVIKSLYYMYTPFVDRLKMVRSEEHPDVLKRRLCVLMWHQKFKDKWVYYFKLRQEWEVLRREKGKSTGSVDWIEQLEDVCANSEDNCRILQVTCLNFIPVLPVQGLFLTSVGVTLSQGFRHNRVQLVFNTSLAHPKTPDESSVTILLDPVINIRILDWWHPLYPQSFNLNLLLNKED